MEIGTTQPKNILLRADANLQIGTGHVMRCLALAQAWQDAGGEVTFVATMLAPALAARLEAEKAQVVRLNAEAGSTDDAAHTIRLAREIGAIWVVVDGYHFDGGYQRAVKDAGLGLLCVDDNGDVDHYYADVVLNQNLPANPAMYASREPYTQLLLGTRYVLLRREFLKWRDWKREVLDIARRVLVTMGGSDPDNVTLKVNQALPQVEVDGLEATVVIGAGNPHARELNEAARASRVPIRLETNALNMPELMAWADVAVSGGGSTCWELAFMGLPTIALVLADNQDRVGALLEAQGIAISLGRSESIAANEIAESLKTLLPDPTRRSAMACAGRAIVDGEGAVRVVRQLSDKVYLELRPARKEDRRLVWEWANDPEARAASFSTESIPWEDHVRWFKSKIQDPRCFFYIATNCDNRPLGQIRFEVEGDRAIVSVSLARPARGRGYGAQLIALASHQVFRGGARAIHAYAKPDNAASVRAFEKAGFVNLGSTCLGEHPAIHLVLEKNESH